ncbi:hypothetical protein SSX86_023214 [Deinandra increscens subsp. villosa]|uniref:Reverse transcriptase zinc-binding domain-containing protein n=1 Tax=Deinandra increscens subsp. villosa TaxID=3103831 RepID=A0AAP0CS29_9ASTR
MLQDAVLSEFNVNIEALMAFDGGKWVWRGDPSGDFSIKSIRAIFCEAGQSLPPPWAFAWCKLIPLKVNLFMWRAVQNRVATYDQLVKRGVQTTSVLCPLCGSMDESICHLLSGCSFSSAVWSLVASWVKIFNMFFFSVVDIVKAVDFLPLENTTRMALCAILFTTCWVIWLERNEAIFNKRQHSVNRVFNDIKSVSFHWVGNRLKSRKLSWEDWSAFKM